MTGPALKRALDVALSAVALVLLAPLMALVALLVRLDSPGPALFRQTRLGRGRRPFELLKFRTMVHGAPTEPHRDEIARQLQMGDAPPAAGRTSFKLADDPRITRVGRWLRTTSLDELPQLVNVLRGEMSLIGPRPVVPYEVDRYEPWQHERFAMPPGMSGLWQVSGRGGLSYRRMCELDVEYVRRWSHWLDLTILLRTPLALIRHREPLASAAGEASELGGSPRWEVAAALGALLFSGLDVAGWVRAIPAARLGVRALWIVLYLAAGLRLVQLPGKLRLARRHWMLAVLLGVALASASWSLAPRESLRMALSLAGTTCLGVAIGAALPARALARAVGGALLTLVVLSLLSLPLLPEWIVVEPLTGKWRGLTDHKNTLASLAAIGALLFAVWALRRGAGRRRAAAACAACVLAVLLPRSVTAMLALGAGAAALAWFPLARRRGLAAAAALALLLGGLGLGLGAAALARAPLTAALGKDPTLNGRTPLWSAAVRLIAERPLTGYGYGAVWHRREDTLLPEEPITGQRSASSAHNALLDAASQIGAPAALLLLAYYLTIWFRAARRFQSNPDPFALFALALLTALGVTNLVEAYLLRIHSPFWILFVAVAVSLTPRRSGPRRP